jgi:hypothetical protein
MVMIAAAGNGGDQAKPVTTAGLAWDRRKSVIDSRWSSVEQTQSLINDKKYGAAS